HDDMEETAQSRQSNYSALWVQVGGGLNLLTDAKAMAKTEAKSALVYTCPVCRVSNADPMIFKQHFESEHPKSPMVPVLVDVQ
uniref:Uncharacterized protein n=1 Tax=Hucho hucho TaxID=62062 RepID=A0A4W5RXM0_9TELE